MEEEQQQLEVLHVEVLLGGDGSLDGVLLQGAQEPAGGQGNGG